MYACVSDAAEFGFDLRARNAVLSDGVGAARLVRERSESAASAARLLVNFIVLNMSLFADLRESFDENGEMEKE
jgi:hypothetical protein